MSSIPTPATPTIEHPVWCEPKYCETTDADVHHVSRTIKYTSKDAELELWLVRSEEFAYPDEQHTTEIGISLASTTLDQRGQQGAVVVFDAFELQRFLCQALGLAALAQHDGALIPGATRRR